LSDEPSLPISKRVDVPPPPPPPPIPPIPQLPPTSGADKPARQRRLITIVVAATVVMVIVAVSVIYVASRTHTKPVALTLAFRSGQFRQAQMTMHLTGTLDAGSGSDSMDLSMSSDLQLVVVEMDPSGSAIITMAQTNVTMSAGGIDLSPGVPTAARLKIANDGALIESVGAPLVAGGGVEAEFAASNLSAILPDGSVEPGDTWTKYINETIMHNQLGFRTTSTYLRNEDVGSVNAAVVETKATIPFDLKVPKGDLGDMGGFEPHNAVTGTYSYNGTLTTDTTSWIDPLTHRLLKTSVTVHSNLGESTKDPATGNPQGDVTKAALVLTVTFP
jgi:hypothetical protein